MTKEADQYAVEQTKLRDQQGYVPEQAGDDIRIKAPKQENPEVNPELFNDVVPMLFRGFLHATATINDVPFVFKSLNHHEFERIGFHGGIQSNNRADLRRHYDLFLAYGVLMVGGVNVLINRDEQLPELVDFFGDLGESARRKVIFELSELSRRATRAIILIEAFVMEAQSRLRWGQVNGLDLTSTAVTGVEGTTTLGLNWGQLTWRALNHYEDLKEVSEREWENAKFVASATAGKGMSKVHAQDKLRLTTEKDERLVRRDKILRYALLGEDPSKVEADYTMTVARSVEELADQLEKDLRGEKDWHDTVVDSHDRRVRQEREHNIDRIRAIQTEYEEKYGDQPVIGSTGMEGLSSADVQHRMTRKRQLMAQRVASRQVFREANDPKLGGFMDKWHPVQPRKDDLGLTLSDKPRGLSIPRGEED